MFFYQAAVYINKALRKGNVPLITQFISEMDNLISYFVEI